MKVLLMTPPFTQFNSPYPATAYLKSYLKNLGYEVYQYDMSLKLTLEIFNPSFIKEISHDLKKLKNKTDKVLFFLDSLEEYLQSVADVVSFLQKPTVKLAKKINKPGFLPEGPRFLSFDEQKDLIPQEMAKLSEMELAKYRSSLYLDDIADIIKEEIDPDFGFSRYAESIAVSAYSFDELSKTIKSKNTKISQLLAQKTQKIIEEIRPDVVGFTVPFPGNLLGALLMAKTIKKLNPKIYTVMGGGYPNTELRTIEDARLFKWIDFLTFDDGEKPLENLLLFLSGKIKKEQLIRTYFCNSEQKIIKDSMLNSSDVKFKELSAPDYSDFNFDEYISMMEMPNYVHRLWSDGKWNKMILAHGCYWKKCTFCDVSLDYIGRYEADSAKQIVDKMEKIMSITGSNGFHFVDEAAPPQLLLSMSEEIIKRKLSLKWWGNIRFDKFFTQEVCQKMKKAGCVAVTGGIEVATERVLKLINKGVSLKDVTKVTGNFTHSGILVHAYLMYGFPSQTVQETIDSLENVRQLFLKGHLQSAFWHRFALTVHSPVAKEPERFGIKKIPLPRPIHGVFAINEIPYKDKIKIDNDALGIGLKRALYNYMIGLGLDMEIPLWFDIKVPKPTKNG